MNQLYLASVVVRLQSHVRLCFHVMAIVKGAAVNTGVHEERIISRTFPPSHRQGICPKIKPKILSTRHLPRQTRVSGQE